MGWPAVIAPSYAAWLVQVIGLPLRSSKNLCFMRGQQVSRPNYQI